MKKVSLLSIAIAIFVFIAISACKSPEDRMKDALNKLENVVEETADDVVEEVEEATVDSATVEEAEVEEEEAH